VDAASLAEWREIIARFDHPLRIPRDEARRPGTLAELRERERAARAWFRSSSRFVQLGGREGTGDTGPFGDPVLWGDLREFLAGRGLAAMDEEFTAVFVSNPYSGETVKGHRIVLAELGLVSFEDKVVRDPDLFSGLWSRARREDHVLWRLAFLRALFREMEWKDQVVLYRGMALEGPPAPLRNTTFVSASFSFDVARSLFEPESPGTNGVLLRQEVPLDRLFMTYLETEAMNRQFLEAEAVLLYEEGNPLF